MQLLKTYQAKLTALKKQIPEFAKEAIVSNSNMIVDILKFGQLEQGLDSLGNIVGRYAITTQGYANADNISSPKNFGDPYNFNWTGETLDNLKIGSVNKSQKTYRFTTVAYKKRLLEDLYGEIFELTEEHNDYVNRAIIEPYVAKKIEENIAQFL